MRYPILFDANAKEYSTNGLGILKDAISCKADTTLNGGMTLEMKYPVKGRNFESISDRSIIAVPNTVGGTRQAYRVYRVSSPINGVCTVYAYHISYDLKAVCVDPFKAGSVTAALEGLKSNAINECAFDFWTDKSVTSDFSLVHPDNIKALLGGQEGSVLDVYGGEYEFDNFLVKLYQRRGEDRGVTVRYGKNMLDFQRDFNAQSVYTGICPYWQSNDGETVVMLPEKFINSEDGAEFSALKVADASQDFEEAPTEQQLRDWGLSYLKQNDIGAPSISWKIDFLQLDQTDEYKDIIGLRERIWLGDTVHIVFPQYKIDAKSRCTRTVYNVLAERYDKIELGNIKSSFSQKTTANAAETKKNEKKNMSALAEAVSRATKLITGNLGGYVVLHSSSGSDTPDEILIMDKPDINSATRVWRWNLSGLGYSGTGYNGEYGLAMTMDGAINADFITAGTLIANLIKTGVLESKDGNTFFLDLDTGELRMNAKSLQINSETVYDGKTVDAKIEASAEKIKSEITKSNEITGGGNFILNSKSMENADAKGSGGNVEYSGDAATVTNTDSNRYFRFTTAAARVTKGVTMCLSVMYKPISGTDELCMQIAYKQDASGSQVWASVKAGDQKEIIQTDGWVLRYGTWTPAWDGTLSLVDIGSGANNAGFGSYTNSFSLMHPMLQYGETPTAWNASSGDYLTQDSAKSLFEQTAEEIKTEVSQSVTETVTENVKETATAAANSAVDSKMQDYATTATVESLKKDVSGISQKADSISTKVSSLEETTTTLSNGLDDTNKEFKTVKESVSAIDQKADSITQTVTQRITGGNNIATGTADWNNASVDAGGNASSKKGSYTITGESVRVTNKAQNTRFHFGADSSLLIAKGMTYCASVLYKQVSGTDGLFLQFETKSTSGTKTYYGSAFKNAQQDIALDNGWKLRWAAFTATADGYADGLFVSTANDSTTITNDLYIMHPMVQMGNSPTAWTASTGDYLTTTETKTEIKQTVSEIKLSATTSGTTSTIKLTSGGIEITSAKLDFSGVVTFSDLSTWNQDKTIINGGNITTGQIHNLKYSTVYDLDNATIRMGTESGERVFIDNRHIAWYATINTGEIGLTGVLYSEAGSSYIGACSKYAKYGWVNGINPTSYVGMQITYNRSDDSDADFNTTRVGVSGTLNCQNLSAWGSKSRIVNTSFGARKLAAFETPTPTFADWGRGECGEDGLCIIVPDPRFAETIAKYQDLTWILTDCTGSGSLWAESLEGYAAVHGAPGQRFTWLAMAAQRGYEGEYAEPSECSYPKDSSLDTDLVASEAARALSEDCSSAEDLLTLETSTKSITDTLLQEVEV